MPDEGRLSDSTASFLESNDLLPLAKRHPGTLMKILAGRDAEASDGEAARALAEVVLKNDRRGEAGLGEAAGALVRLHSWIVKPGPPEESLCTIELYDRLIERIVTDLELSMAGRQASPVIAVESIAGSITLQWDLSEGGSNWHPRSFRFVPGSQFDHDEFDLRVTAEGIGARFVATRRAGIPEVARPAGGFFPSYSFLYPITIVADVERSEEQDARIVLRPVDPLERTRVVISGRDMPLSFDLTAALVALVEETEIKERGREGLRRAERAMPETGLFLLEPFRPDKIPVVLIHGLDASTATWITPYNRLLANPRIREHYQFWFFNYPSALPFLYSAHLLREAIDETTTYFDEGSSNDNLSRMVLIGHSLGGLVARIMVTSAGDTFWAAVSDKPLDEIELSAEDDALVREIYYVEPMPLVSRAVFIATPHKGSPLAAGVLGRMGAALVEVPSAIKDLAERVIHATEGHLTPTVAARHRAPDSIETLSPTDPYIVTLKTLPPVVPFHSIMGERWGSDRLNSSDGFVRYSSAHLGGAESEIIIPGGHDIHHEPAAVDEIIRILLLHLEK